MSTEVKPAPAARRRTSVYVDGQQHINPIPAACRIDNVVYSSMIHGIDTAAGGVAPTLAAQAELMFARLAEIVTAAGGTPADVVKVNVRMRRREDRDAINRFWVDLFPDAASRPARQTLNADLDGEQLIQCDFVAVIGDHEREDGRS